MRPATKTDTPEGGEVQCPVCWRLFANHTTADLHEKWSRGKGLGDLVCHDPATKGCVPVERRGLIVWHTPKGAERSRQDTERLRAVRARKATTAPGSVK